MAQIASKERLLRISKAPQATFMAWDEGIHIQATTGRSLVELRDRATADRIALSKHFLKDGLLMLDTSSALGRSAISRFYYSMYHAMRAVVYYQYGGDDHEKHSMLPTKTPSDFPSGVLWRNTLKDAREKRNSADYDPYPKSLSTWSKTASALSLEAADLLDISRQYLRGKGSQFI